VSVHVGVDGGQSELRLTIAGSGRVHTGPGFVYGCDVVPGTVAAVRTAWAQVHGAPQVARAVLGLTGLPVTAEGRERLAGAVAELTGAEEVLLCADYVTAHAGALGAGRGVVLAVGTGVGCLAVDPDTGTCHKVDAWGHLFGDDGSAFAIGRAGIAAALRAVDGRGRATVLVELAERAFGPVGELAQRLYTAPSVVDETARFAVQVASVAGSDEVAVAILRTAAAELATTAAAAVAALPGPGSVPVACTGRLVDSTPALREGFRAELSARCPRARHVAPGGTALDGACLLAGRPDPGAYRPLVHVHRRRGDR
jgi:glucosamine kinase